jgi:hypothetical protein
MAQKRSKLAEIKTKQTAASVEEFINAVPNEQKREDSFVILEMMKKATGEVPKMWGTSIIGFGKKIYKSPATGREVEWFLVGFSPRKANLTVYLVSGLQQHVGSLKKFGKHSTGGGCIYFNKLADIDIKILKDMIDASLRTGFDA